MIILVGDMKRRYPAWNSNLELTLIAACVLTTMCVQLDLLSPFQLYFNPILVWKSYQLWRLLTTFLFFGTFGFNFFFNMIFTYRYCRMLEENSFRGRTADFVTMFIFGSVFMIFSALFVNLLFLGKIFFLSWCTLRIPE